MNEKEMLERMEQLEEGMKAIKEMLDNLPPTLPGAIELHRKWLETGGQEGIRFSLRGADLRGADLRSVNLADSFMASADLSGAFLISANIRDADLDGADLRDSTLSGVDFRRADLSGSNLSGANFSNPGRPKRGKAQEFEKQANEHGLIDATKLSGGEK